MESFLTYSWSKFIFGNKREKHGNKRVFLPHQQNTCFHWAEITDMQLHIFSMLS